MIEHIWILIAKKLNGEATEEELRYLEQFFKERGTDSPISVLEEVWQKTTQPVYPSNDDLEEKWASFDAQLNILEQAETTPEIPHRTRIKTIVKYGSYAAAILLFATFFYRYHQPADNVQGITSVAAPQFGVSKITLPDGSNVWLNSGSKISYRNNEENNCREVSLSGEAYFDVVKDHAHPFTVTTNAFKITVLGTAFNVRSYAKGQSAEATLVRGRIELVVLKNPERKYILNPSEKLILSKTPTPKNKTNKDTGDFTSVELKKVHGYIADSIPNEVLWTKTVIDFDNTDFVDIAEMMEHKYNVKIVFKQEAIKYLQFTGRFKNESVEEALKEMQATVKFHYKIDDNQIEIY